MKSHIQTIGSPCGNFVQYQWLVTDGLKIVAQGFEKTSDQAQQTADLIIASKQTTVVYYGYTITVKRLGNRFVWSYVSKYDGSTEGIENTEGAAIYAAKQSIYTYDLDRLQNEYSESLVCFNNKMFDSAADAEASNGLTIHQCFTIGLDNIDALKMACCVLDNQDMTYGVVNSECVFFDIHQTVLLNNDTLRMYIELVGVKND